MVIAKVRVPANTTPAARNWAKKFSGRAMPQNAKHGSGVSGATMSRRTLHTCFFEPSPSAECRW